MRLWYNTVMQKRKDGMKRVIVALDLSRKSRRDFLSGFFDQCGRRSEWGVRILQSSSELTPDVVRRWEKEGVDGVIVAEDGVAGTEAALVGSSVPAVFVGSRDNWLRRRERNAVFLRIDDEAIGVFAAERLMRLGAFRSAAFLAAGAGEYWSMLRGCGFRAVFERRNVPFFECGPEDDVGEFVNSLPKPAAVFAACDRIAHAAVSQLRDPQRVIPGSVALLGTDDDEMLCNSTRPRLSSIRPNHYREGVVAQRELESLMRARKERPAKNVLCGGCELVERESTVPVAPAAMLVSRAIEFISRQAVHGITPDDVAAHCGVSRRLLDLRFREQSPDTVGRMILSAKLEAARRIVESTGDRMVEIARQCGFANANHLKNAFVARFGVSMREWRAGVRPG